MPSLKVHMRARVTGKEITRVPISRFLTRSRLENVALLSRERCVWSLICRRRGLHWPFKFIRVTAINFYQMYPTHANFPSLFPTKFFPSFFSLKDPRKLPTFSFALHGSKRRTATWPSRIPVAQLTSGMLALREGLKKLHAARLNEFSKFFRARTESRTSEDGEEDKVSD